MRVGRKPHLRSPIEVISTQQRYVKISFSWHAKEGARLE